MVSFPQVSPPEPCAHLSLPPYQHASLNYGPVLYHSLQWILRNQIALTPTFQDQAMVIQSNANQ